MNIGRAGLAAAVCAVALCSGAWADGEFFSAADDVREPNQKAPLWLDGDREAVHGAVDAAEEALSSGTLAPLRLEFAASELVCPLYIASLGRGATDEPFRAAGARGPRRGGEVPRSASGGATRPSDHLLTVPECLLLGILVGAALILIAGALRRLAARSR